MLRYKRKRHIGCFFLETVYILKILRWYVMERGNPPGSTKPFTAFLRAHTYRKGERRGRTADLISPLPPEGELAAGERKKYKSHKDAAGQNDLMQDSPPRPILERSLAVLVRHEP